MKKLQVLMGVCVLLLFSCAEVKENSSTQKKKLKNIIFMVGDGMGTTQVYAGLTKKKGDLNLKRMTSCGFSCTYSFDNYITDSAAGATAFSTGVKTYNGAIGVSSDTVPLETIMEKAQLRGLSTGLVVTCGVTHATPASFVSHRSNRGLYEDIALDMSNANVDVLIGGGYEHFAKRKDSINLVTKMVDRGYDFVGDLSGLQDSKADKILALLYPEHPPMMSEGRGDMLTQGVKKALEVLSKNEEGFFLLVEGSQIDWGGHKNDVDYLVNEMVDFDNTIGKVLDWAEKDGETLVVVTADHETGGLSLTGGDIKTGKVEGKFSTKHHTGVMVPVFAFGPNSKYFSGIYENIDIHSKLNKVLFVE